MCSGVCQPLGSRMRSFTCAVTEAGLLAGVDPGLQNEMRGEGGEELRGLVSADAKS